MSIARKLMSSVNGSSPPAPGEEEWGVPGVYEWSVPAGLEEVTLCMIGGGGGGSLWLHPEETGRGGGAGDIKNNITVNVSGLDTVSYTVGSGGTGGTETSESRNGSTSRFGAEYVNGGFGAGHSGNGNPVTNCYGTFNDGLADGSNADGGEGGFADGGNANLYGEGFEGSKGSGGGGSERGSSGGSGGHGLVKIKWG